MDGGGGGGGGGSTTFILVFVFLMLFGIQEYIKSLIRVMAPELNHCTLATT